jgi:hypothetical protein
MKSSDIKTGETYMFVATDSPARKHLEGQPFTVYEIKAVWRRIRGTRKVKRFFNEDGVGARADELEPLDSGNTTEKPADDDLPF